MLRVCILVAAQLCVCAAWQPLALRAPGRPAALCVSARGCSTSRFRHISISMLSGGGGSTGGDVPFSGDNMEGRGDLAGGQNVERNAQVAALKKAFYNSEAPDRAGGGGGFAEGTGQVSLLGVLRDMPVCRWEMHMLPGFNHVLNVWQPMYTHMFEAILAQKQPWYYVHLQTPGGTKNLMHPDFNLGRNSEKSAY